MAKVLMLAALVAAGCGDGGAPAMMMPGVLSASFSNLVGANTSGAAITTTNVQCQYTPATSLLSCSGTELPNGNGRVVDVTVRGPVVAGMDYPIGMAAAGSATVAVRDPTTYGTASGLRQWQAVDGSGSVHVAAFDVGAKPHVAFSYFAGLQALGSPATGTFTVAGDASIDQVMSTQL